MYNTIGASVTCYNISINTAQAYGKLL